MTIEAFVEARQNIHTIKVAVVVPSTSPKQKNESCKATANKAGIHNCTARATKRLKEI